MRCCTCVCCICAVCVSDCIEEVYEGSFALMVSCEARKSSSSAFMSAMCVFMSCTCLSSAACCSCAALSSVMSARSWPAARCRSALRAVTSSAVDSTRVLSFDVVRRRSDSVDVCAVNSRRVLPTSRSNVLINVDVDAALPIVHAYTYTHSAYNQHPHSHCDDSSHRARCITGGVYVRVYCYLRRHRYVLRAHAVSLECRAALALNSWSPV